LNLSTFVDSFAPTSFAVDSRLVEPGGLFVALRGGQTDGHTFVEAAKKSGAIAVVVEEAVEVDLPQFVVSDSLEALAELARLHLAKLGSARIFGITGTVGKTTAKDMLAHLLGGTDERVHAAPASYNSEIGLPLAILSAPLTTQKLVLEFGISHAGDMRPLTAIASPNDVWFTALTRVHLEGFASFDELVEEKSKLMHGPTAPQRVWGEPGVLQVLRRHAPVATHKECKVPFEETNLLGHPGAWSLPLLGEQPFEIPVIAKHEVVLAATAVEIAHHAGVAARDIRQRLTTLPRPPGRLELRQQGQVSFLHDAYNASPASMRAALGVLESWPTQGRRIAVLGTMHELGNAAEDLHREMGQVAAECGLNLIVGVGAYAEELTAPSRLLGIPTLIAIDRADFAGLLAPQLRTDDFILLKASRAEALETGLPELMASAAQLTSQQETNL